MQLRHGAYYHVCNSGGKQSWFRLSSDYSEALRIWAEREGSTHKKGTTVSHMINRYLIEILPSLSPKTVQERTRQAVGLDSAYGNMPLHSVKPHHIAAYLDRRSAKVAANREITFLSSMYQYAMRWGWCESNPCTGIRRNAEKRRTRYITDIELDTLINTASKKMAVIIEIAYLTAMRKSDLLAIRINDIKPDGLYVRPSKTMDSSGTSMVFNMTPKLKAAVLKAMRKDAIGHLFTNTQGNPYTISGFNSVWRRLKIKTGIIDIHFHDIRAKALTDAKRQSGSDYAQELGNHASIQTTETYIKQREITRVNPLG
jgi:integrase